MDARDNLIRIRVVRVNPERTRDARDNQDKDRIPKGQTWVTRASPDREAPLQADHNPDPSQEEVIQAAPRPTIQETAATYQANRMRTATQIWARTEMKRTEMTRTKSLLPTKEEACDCSINFLAKNLQGYAALKIFFWKTLLRRVYTPGVIVKPPGEIFLWEGCG